ncbi:MAG: GatB/YqeY domain-containing protein [Patescibacteria group bacterium]
MLTLKVKDDMKEAMKAKDDLRVQTLRGAMAAFTNELVAKGKKPTDEVDNEMAQTVLKRLAKQRKDSIEQFTKGNRPELAEKEAKELAIIESYLPQMASEAEVEKIAKEKIAEMGADKTKMGQIMGATMKALDGNADGAVVKKVVEKLLS